MFLIWWPKVCGCDECFQEGWEGWQLACGWVSGELWVCSVFNEFNYVFNGFNVGRYLLVEMIAFDADSCIGACCVEMVGVPGWLLL